MFKDLVKPFNQVKGKDISHVTSINLMSDTVQVDIVTVYYKFTPL